MNNLQFTAVNQMTEAPTLSRGVHHNGHIVLVDGITRTGKSMMGPILASLDRVELERVEEILEYIGMVHRLGKISTDAAITLLRMETDMQLYNSMIGRNTNFRFADHSSVWRNPNRLRYFSRILGKDGAAALRRITEDKPIFQNQTHDQLMNFPLYYQAFGERLRMVEMIRHPVDLVDSWMRRGWGERFGIDPLALTMCVKYQNQDLPFYALGWEENFLSTSPLGRVIRMIAQLWDAGQATCKSLSPAECKGIFIVSFESFVEHPNIFLERIADFLGSRTTRHTASALKRQRCPRSYSMELRKQKQNVIEAEATSEEKFVLSRLIQEYETLATSLAK